MQSDSVSSVDQERPMSAFISFSHIDIGEATRLQHELQVRGVRTWLFNTDLDVGRFTDDAIKQIIDDESDIAVIYLSDASLKSDYIWEREVPWIQARWERDRDYGVLPVFRRLRSTGTQINDPNYNSVEIKKAVDEECTRQGLRILSGYNGHHVPPRDATDDTEETVGNALVQLARLCLKSALLMRLKRVGALRDRTYEPTISFHTTQFEPPCESLDVDVDWTHLFTGRTPTESEWRETLLPGLRDLKAELSARVSSRTLHIVPQSSIPASLAFGFIFSGTARFNLDIDTANGCWRTNQASSGHEPLRCIPQSIHKGGDKQVAVVQVAIARHTSSDVVNTLASMQISYGHHILLIPAQGPDRRAVTDGGQAVAWAEQIGRELIRLCDAGARHVHFFAAVPTALAMLIGRQLNALPPITSYQHDSASKLYVTQCTLTT